jgi:hypothetical protein
LTCVKFNTLVYSIQKCFMQVFCLFLRASVRVPLISS